MTSNMNTIVTIEGIGSMTPKNFSRLLNEVEFLRNGGHPNAWSLGVNRDQGFVTLAVDYLRLHGDSKIAQKVKKQLMEETSIELEVNSKGQATHMRGYYGDGTVIVSHQDKNWKETSVSSYKGVIGYEILRDLLSPLFVE